MKNPIGREHKGGSSPLLFFISTNKRKKVKVSDIETTETEKIDYGNLPYRMRDISNHIKSLSFHSKKMMTGDEPFCDSEMMTLITNLVYVVNTYHQKKELNPTQTRREKTLHKEWKEYMSYDSFPVKEQEVREYWDKENRNSGKSGIPIHKYLQPSFLEGEDIDEKNIVYVGGLQKDINSLNRKVKRLESEKIQVKSVKKIYERIERQNQLLKGKIKGLENELEQSKTQEFEGKSSSTEEISQLKQEIRKQKKTYEVDMECRFDDISELEEKVKGLEQTIEEMTKQ